MAAPGLNHHRGGSGEPLVAIHGIGSFWRMWEPLLPALERRHDVLAIDLPGYGESPPVDGEPTVPALVDAVEAALDAAGLETAHLLGSSLGGWIAAELAARGRARSVVGLSPAGLWTRKEWGYSHRVLRTQLRAARLLAPVADNLAATAVGRRLGYSAVYAHPERLEPEPAAAALRALAASPSFIGTLDWIDDGPRMPSGLETIRCPVRIAWGTRDLVLPFRQAARWQRIVRGAQVVPLPGLGHLPTDDPELVAEVVLDFTAGSMPRDAAGAAARA
jgi:pimeloyl-ACP methyl ester carboxylesterase